MPVARYFLYVGGVLLALLFVFDATQPKLPVVDRTNVATTATSPVLRIQSDRKWPDKVVYDTSLPTIVPPPLEQAAVAAPVAAPAAEMSVKSRVQESFAQFVEPETRKPEPQQVRPKPKRKVAKYRANPPTMLVAQQPQHFGFGFFGNNTW
jgi:hypothetical protein